MADRAAVLAAAQDVVDSSVEPQRVLELPHHLGLPQVPRIRKVVLGMSERCACGCPQLVTEASPTIFFASASCQSIWVASLKLPEDQRSQWRWRQRFVTLLVHQVQWPYFWDYEFPAEVLINTANEFILTMHQSWEVADEEEAMRVLMLKYMRDSPMSWRSGFDREKVRALIARWPVSLRARATR